MHGHGTKATLIGAMKEKTGIVTSPDPPKSDNIAVVVDAMFMIRTWSFEKGKDFNVIAHRYLQKILKDCPPGTESLHFCCDHYDESSLKTGMRDQRAMQNTGKSVEVGDVFKAPDPTNFFSSTSNKAKFLDYLGENWIQSEELTSHSTTKPKLYIGGGFKECTRTVLKMLPPTEAAFMQHLKRAALATLRDILALSQKPDLPPFDNFGWELTDETLKPVPTTDPMWPDEMLKALTCNCKKGCSRNCP